MRISDVRYLASTCVLGLSMSLGFALPAAAKELKVVASFSILADMVSRIGGDKIDIHAIVGPNGDAHVYQPTPADAEAVATSDLIVINGLGFEGFLDRLLQSAEYKGPVVIASTGVTPRTGFHEEGEEETAEADGHDHGGIDPHAWQSLANARLYAKNIRDGLCSADPEDCPAFTANAALYDSELATLDLDIKARMETIPGTRRQIITSHDAFGYFGDAYGVTFTAPQGMSTESEASAGGVGALIEQIRSTGIKVLFFENIVDPRLIEQIASETGAKLGGALFSDALAPAGEDGATYLGMMKHNADALIGAMSENS